MRHSTFALVERTKEIQGQIKKDKKKKEKEMGKTTSGWLYGWKEIANYIGCDVKTVQKYVAEYKIPIHRFPDKNKIFAIPSEIDGWGMRCKNT